MTVPAAYPITIAINDVDVTSYHTYDGMALEDHARQVSTFRITLKDPSAVLTLARLQSVVVTETTGGAIIFDGYVSEFTERKRGIELWYDLDCQDQKMRLQKSIVSGEFSGLDSTILSSLLSSTYPDLSSLFDFTTDVTSFADGLQLNLEDANLLDALNELADLADADWRMETAQNVGATGYLQNFDDDGPEYTLDASTGDSATDTGTGFTGNCAVATDDSGNGALRLDVDFTLNDVGEPDVDSIEFRYWFDHNGTTENLEPRIQRITGMTTNELVATGESATQTWHNVLFRAVGGSQAPINDTEENTEIVEDALFPITVYDTIRLRLTEAYSGATSAEHRIDDIQINGGAETKSKLQWNEDPDATDWNLDIQSGDEYAGDIDLTIGDLDDYNSITVIGGNEEVAVDWIYDNDGSRTHLDLELPVKNITVYKNTGTDTSPTWTAQTDGIWGTDTLTSAGGSKDVLYDSQNHWLLFDSAPPNLVNAWRITGTIIRPLRVRVENAGSDPVLAAPYHDDSITTVDQAVAAGQAELEKRSGITRLSFKTPHPGLKPGQAITVTDSARSLSATLTIQRITTEWIKGPQALFSVECGEEEFTGLDTMVANNDKRSRKFISGTAPTTQTAVFLTDDSGVLMTDDSGTQMYEVM